MNKVVRTLLVIMIASIGAFIGHILQLPIGILVGSFIAVGIAQIVGLGAAPLPKKARQIVQMVIGGIVGLNMTHDLVPVVLNLLVPGLIAATIHLLFAFLFAIFLTKYFGIDWVTAFCGCIPAGMSEAASTANEVEADVQIVMLMHLFRVSILITVLPWLLGFLV